MWKVILLLFLTLNSYTFAKASSYHKEFKIIHSACMQSKIKKKIILKTCNCIIHNFKKSNFSNDEVKYLVKSYQKKIKQSEMCEGFEQLCNYDWEIVQSCLHNQSYDFTDPNAKHFH